jgi:hypothetical protein
MDNGVRQCITCNNIKLLEDFVINGIYRKSICKVCDNIRRNKHQKDNREYYDVKQKEWRDSHQERNREIVCKAAMRYHDRTRQVALEAVSGVSIEDIKCVQCGFSDIRALQIDHINGGGGKHFRESVSSARYYKEMLVYPENYQILCANCNWIKRYTNNERRSKYEFFDPSSIEEVVFEG